MNDRERISLCGGRGYFPFSRYLRGRFGCRVRKVTLDAGFTCPNRDGTVGVGGCAYCVNESFSPRAAGPRRTIREQMADGMARARRGGRPVKFFAYFQPFTNTYGDVARLRACYDEALSFDDVVGLAIGTRPDCVPDEVLDLVQTYTSRVEVWLEYGVQTVHDRTLQRINRGHNFAAFRDALERTRGRGIRVCVHVILGLPGETRDDMMATAQALAGMGVDGIKLHHLQIVRGAALEEAYHAGEVKVFSAREYVRVACDFLERMPAEVVVQRLAGEAAEESLIAPRWPQTKAAVLRLVAEEFSRRGTTQGSRTGSAGAFSVHDVACSSVFRGEGRGALA